MLPVKTRRQISDAGAHDRWFILSLLFLNYFVIYAHRYIINYIQDPLRKELDLSETQLNMAAASFTFTYAFAQLFVAYLGDRFPRRTVLLASLTLSTIAFFAMGFSQGFYDLLTCRIVLAVTQAACGPSIAGIMADCFTEQNRSRAVAVYLLSSPVGLVFCASAGGWIADTWGWRTAFLCFGTLGVVVIGILAKLLREPERTERTVAGLGVQGGTYLQSLRSVLTVPSFLLLAMAYVLAANVGQQMGFFLPDHFKQH